MDFETVATKENTITTAKNDNAADITDNENAIKASTTKNEEAIYEEFSKPKLYDDCLVDSTPDVENRENEGSTQNLGVEEAKRQ